MADYPDIPGCKIISVLGEGGVSIVYLGIQEKLKRKVAIKVLDPSLLKNKVAAMRFQKEAETAAMLSHSNIVQIFDTGKSGYYHYIVMEYLRESLKDLMVRTPGGKLHPEMALDIVEAIFKALDHAHFKGVYHRDIKPENIMFRQDSTPVLADFGIAHVLDSILLLTKEGTSLGTDYYMSPEQCKAQAVDGRSDIYSLGVILFELLVGEKPYKGKTGILVGLRHIEDPIPQLPRELSRYQPLIDKMMAKDKEQRLSSVIQFKRLLGRILANPVIPAAPAISEIAPGNPIKKRLVVGVPLLALSLLAAVLIFSPGRRNNDEKRQGIPFLKQVHTILVQSITAAKEKHFKEKLKEANSLFDRGKLGEANALVEELKKIKDSPEIIKFEIKIFDKRKKEKFTSYLTNAGDDFKKKNYSNALENISMAKQIKETPELLELEIQIHKAASDLQKELVQAKEREKSRQKDDGAYELASTQDTIAAYKIYLKVFPSGRHSKAAHLKINVLQKKRKVTLRSGYNTSLDDRDVQFMMKQYDFFENNLNNTGSFNSYYEKRLPGKASLIIDYSTGLMWHNGDPPGKMDLENAEKWLKNLNHGKYGGYDDWRFPTLEEASSLLRKNKNKQGFHIDPIFSEKLEKIWTKDHTKGAFIKFLKEEKFWIVCFDEGTVEKKSGNDKYQFRPVRSLKGDAVADD